MQEDQILHDAVKVLRGSLHAVEISKDFYPSPSDLSHHRSLHFIPPSLMTFLSWLVDELVCIMHVLEELGLDDVRLWIFQPLSEVLK
jgi:hypothetical protein